MIESNLVDTINDVRTALLHALEELPQVSSFRSLLRTSPALAAAMEDIGWVASSSHLRTPCEGRLTCAIIGSSGHGKTTILDEMFPRLAERGWLVTDVTDTTAQSLRIEYAPPGSPELDRVVVRSWSGEQIKELMSQSEVEEQNQRDGVRVSYLEDGVEVDGTEAAFAAADRAQFRFPGKLELRPFPGSPSAESPSADSTDSTPCPAMP